METPEGDQNKGLEGSQWFAGSCRSVEGHCVRGDHGLGGPETSGCFFKRWSCGCRFFFRM